MNFCLAGTLPGSSAPATYPAIYQDKHGREQTEILNDGEVLQMTVRGVRFSGSDFDGLSPPPDAAPELLASFVLNQGDLCACALRWTMPLPVVCDELEMPATLEATLVLGEPDSSWRVTQEQLVLELRSTLGNFRSGGMSGWFEDELLHLQSQLPEGSYIKACITCAWSDYSPIGHGLFGGLACFRENKLAYSQVVSKAQLFDLWGKATGSVQETFLCPEYSRRHRGAGYRG